MPPSPHCTAMVAQAGYPTFIEMSPISDHVAKLKGERGVSHFLSDREATLKLLKEVSPISDHVATFKVLKRCQPFQTMLQGYSFQKRCQPLSFRPCCNAADSDPTHSTMGFPRDRK